MWSATAPKLGTLTLAYPLESTVIAVQVETWSFPKLAKTLQYAPWAKPVYNLALQTEDPRFMAIKALLPLENAIWLALPFCQLTTDADPAAFLHLTILATAVQRCSQTQFTPSEQYLPPLTPTLGGP